MGDNNGEVEEFTEDEADEIICVSETKSTQITFTFTVFSLVAQSFPKI